MKSYVRKSSALVIGSRVETIASKKCREFRQNNPELKDVCTFVDNVLMPLIHRDWRAPGIRRQFHMAIAAQVKSGKRLVKTYLAMRVEEECHKTKVVVMTALNRKDCKDQEQKYAEHGVMFFAVHDTPTLNKVIADIKKLLADGWHVLAINDECDYGSGCKQLLAQVYKDFGSNYKVGIIGVSASLEELLFSGKVLQEHRCTYKPSANHCGASWYLKNDLVIEAEPFIVDNSVTMQGAEILNGLVESDKDFVGVRFPSGLPECVKDGLQKDGSNPRFLKQIQASASGIEHIHVISGKNPFTWNNDGEWWRWAGRKKTLLIVEQTATRSTEFGKEFLRRLYAWHDYRSNKKGDDSIKNASYATMIQAFMRVTFFSDGKKDLDIRPLLYCHEDTIRLAASLADNDGKFTYADWKGKLHCRIGKTKGERGYRLDVIGDTFVKGATRNVHTNKEDIYQYLLNCNGNRSTDGTWFLADCEPIHASNLTSYRALRAAKPHLFGKRIRLTLVSEKAGEFATKNSAYNMN